MRTKEEGWPFWLREDLSPEEMRLKACGVGGVNLFCDPPEMIDAYIRCAKEKLDAIPPAKLSPAEAAMLDVTLENFETEVIH